MPVTLLNPQGLPDLDVYRQVSVATGSRSVFVAGQVARDADGNPVAPEDLAGQVVQAFRNIAVALEAADTPVSDVVRLTIYVVDWSIEKMPALLEGMAKATAELGLAPAPVTLIGVAALFESDVLVEIEATAVTDR